MRRVPAKALCFLILLPVVFAATACGPKPVTLAPTPRSGPLPLLPTKTPGPTGALVPTRAPVPPVADDWARVKADGKIVVGTSADYAPFAFRTANFELDGFDVALIREIARRLNLQIEIKDLAFNGLLSALKLEQIDTAIAAISVTPERTQKASFTRPYYEGEDAVLGRPDDTSLTIRLPENMVGRKIAVQRGSVYETWLQDTLVTRGLIPQQALLPYTDVRQAISDMLAKRVDLVVMDFLPAQAYVNAGQARLVGRGLNPQSFAIAFRLDSSLQAPINDVLAKLRQEGYLTALAGQYLKLEPADVVTPVEPVPAPSPLPSPLPTALPEPPTATPAVCVPGMAWVLDLNLDDRALATPAAMQPGQSFAKGWRIKNTGTCPWPPTYTLAPDPSADSAVMGGQPLIIGQSIPVNGTMDVYVNISAPQAPGIYKQPWLMRDDGGQWFGERLWARITVPALPSPPPPTTQAPTPGIQFWADAYSIPAGNGTVFHWATQNVKAVYFYIAGQPWQQNGVTGTDQRTVYPSQTTTYELRVVRQDGTADIRQIQIQVQPNTGAPTIVHFDATPGQVQTEQQVDLDWEVQGSVNYVRLWAGGRAVWDNLPTRGHIEDNPANPGDLQYVLESGGPGGVSRLERWVRVVQDIPANPPHIDYFQASTDRARRGQCFDLTWGLSGGRPDWVSIDRNGSTIADNPGGTRFTDCPSGVGIFSYALATGNGAGEKSRSLSIQVVP